MITSTINRSDQALKAAPFSYHKVYLFNSNGLRADIHSIGIFRNDSNDLHTFIDSNSEWHECSIQRSDSIQTGVFSNMNQPQTLHNSLFYSFNVSDNWLLWLSFLLS